MSMVITIGDGADSLGLVLASSGHDVAWVRDERSVRHGGWSAELVVAAVSEPQAAVAAARIAEAMSAPWLAWVRAEAAEEIAAVTTASRARGAGAVCGPGDPLEGIGAAADQLLAAAARQRRRRVVTTGSTIDLGGDELLVVHAGTVIVRVYPLSGADPVWVGLLACGDAQPGGPRQQLQALSTATVERVLWSAAMTDPATPGRLRRGQHRAQRWSTHASVDPERAVLNLLRELAADYGQSDDRGSRVVPWVPLRSDVGTAVGRTAQTVSRVLSGLARRGLYAERGGAMVISAELLHCRAEPALQSADRQM